MRFGKLTLSPGQVRSFVIVTGILLLFLIVIDPVLRPPLREMTIEDYLEAEGLYHQKPLNDTQNTQYTTAPVNNTTSTTRILIVSAMFPLAKAKHSKADYEHWLAQFLGPITTDIYMYTTPDLGETLRRVRGDLPITIDTNYSSPFEVPPLRDLEETYTRMNDMDAEKWHHSPGLYAVWNAKPYLLNDAVNVLKAQGKVYDYAFWNDGGSFRREHHYSDWPNPARVDQVWEEGSKLTGQSAEDLLFFPVFQPPVEKFKHWQEAMGPIANPVQLSEGILKFYTAISEHSNLIKIELFLTRLLLWRLPIHGRLVFQGLLRIPQSLSLARPLRRDRPGRLQLHLPPLPRAHLHRLAERPARARARRHRSQPQPRAKLGAWFPGRMRGRVVLLSVLAGVPAGARRHAQHLAEGTALAQIGVVAGA